MYLDFFSINAQRCALNISANCCQILHPEDFDLVSGSLSLLVSRLTHQDRRSVESVCLGLSRLVENCQSDAGILKQIGSKELLKNLQQLLVVSPPVVSQGTFIMIVRMLAVMCGACPDVAVELMRENIVETLSYLLTGSGGQKNTEDVELLSRSPQELFEIVSLIAELMPTLPENEPLFSVDALMMKPVPGPLPSARSVSTAFLPSTSSNAGTLATCYKERG
jgi:E3 ubiquitin-protein ligase TRIP12